MERPPFADDPKFRALSPESKMAVLAEWQKKNSASDGRSLLGGSEAKLSPGEPESLASRAWNAAREFVSGDPAREEAAAAGISQQPTIADLAKTGAAAGGAVLGATPFAYPAATALGIAGGYGGAAAGRQLGNMAEYVGAPSSTSKVLAGVGGVVGGIAGPMVGPKLISSVLPHVGNVSPAAKKLIEWFGRKTAEKAAAVEGAAQKQAVEEIGAKWQQMLKERAAVPETLPAAAPRPPVLSSGTVPTPVPLRLVPPRMSASVPVEAVEAAAPKAEAAAVEAVKKIKARAKKPAAPAAESAAPVSAAKPPMDAVAQAKQMEEFVISNAGKMSPAQMADMIIQSNPGTRTQAAKFVEQVLRSNLAGENLQRALKARTGPYIGYLEAGSRSPALPVTPSKAKFLEDSLTLKKLLEGS